MRRTQLARFDDAYFEFCPAKSQLYRVVVKSEKARGPWQMPPERLIDDPASEGGTDFLAYATGAPAHFAWCNCCRVVVAGDADRPGARANRPQRQTALRV